MDIKTNTNRANCSCLASIDIGAYSCNLVAKNMAIHDDESPMLLGTLSYDDKVNKRIVASNKVRQIKLDI